MKQLVNNLKGDKGIWSFVALLALFSFMPVFSASSNLAYIGQGNGNTLGYLVKHIVHICIGFTIIFMVHKVPYHYFKAVSKGALYIVWVLLAYTLIKGTVIAGANASRWIQVPFIGVTFQTSTLAAMVLFIFVARYLSKTREVPISFKSSIWELWLPVFITLAFILPANFSTTALIFSMVLMLVFIGKYPLRYIGIVVGSGIVFLAFFILVAKAFPDAFPNRVDTWISRIDNFTSDKPDEDDYQIEKAKIAIASGKIYGLGPGKSVQKNFLPQSSSDFIFAIIVEEYGLLGGLGVLMLYLLLLFRFVIASHKANSLFGKLVVVGLGFPMIFQAMVNMAVAVELLPVTGQTLPLISSGGSSIWMTCFALGIIISVTKKEEEIAQELKDAAKREEALQKLIDRELEEEEVVAENYSIEDKANNPMHAVLNK
ncbi:MAG: FtsW/RodA/SpoVE family cell cycle protein [Flavobacterium sp.]|jgi:cell division protein FtsW|uniref:Probable peptidoglycan glycosyltransferase FtsW n=1 Tax=Flavobacterium algoritolerans TaxID=3041254 RepID=A0ABT6V5P9_9FLAO|nr:MULTISPECIES: FtsW/RodA/SpoVE family cell cycle protein [Flavobacterium]MDI5886549.1 FtsW/RodA/SpoVE family cell cycle protein [Flavobacterium yafengii]MDI5893563.1 FtsW/RodA/SpoVE family cell cycle protein [Flavobacterium algoritolerans]MDI6048731.1 FtsW/RodA/SpoVE family cell cycle protein [Flavobacterium sp. XS2P24]MDP3681115.1 FtsW/RodA/SpoVE family cell cycle protein [Flavobacterium sp.]MDZ4330031.1 FtsW/RodA/SpoVE family cell cycle protein [Flavobacterium sp.]